MQLNERNMKTGIKDKNGIEICVGDRVRRVNRLDNSTVWKVHFGEFKVMLDNTMQTIYTLFLVDVHSGYREVMETEIHWQWQYGEDRTEYEIVK